MRAAAWLLLAAAAGTAVASEYPERECCDPVDPPMSMSATPGYVAAAAAEAAAGLETTVATSQTADDGHRGTYAAIMSFSH